MTTDLLNNLSKVLKKGPSETQKNSLSCEAQSAAEKLNRVLITCLSRVNHLIQYRCMRYAAMIFAVLVMSMANIGMAWGVDITVTRFALNGTTIYAINQENKMFHDEVEFTLSTTPSLSSNLLSVPASSVLTIGAHGKTITKIVIEWNSANNSSTFSSGSATWKNSNKTMTWTGSTTSLAITSGAASRVNSAVITYTDADPLSGVTTTTLSSFSRIYSSSGACMYSSKTNSAYGVNIQGALDSNNPVGLSKNASNSLFTNGLRLVSPKPISSVVYTWTVAPTAASVSSGTYNSSTSTWTAANTTTTEVTIYNNGTGTAKFSQIVVNFVGSTPECEDVDAPTSLSCTAHTQTSLTFGWTKASNASGYVAKLWDNSSCTGDAVATENIANGNTETVTFSGLTAGTTYYCKVQSKGDGTDYCEDGGTTSAANGTTDACTAISPTWSYPFSTVAVGITIYPTIGGNTGEGDVTYTSSATSKITNACYATAAGSATLTANVAANGVYCSGSVTSGTITVVADQSGLIKQTLTTGESAWGTPSAPATTDGTNITSTTVLSATNLTISGNGNTSNGGQTAKITGMTTGSEGDNSGKYMQMGFTVKSGKQLNVSAIYIPVQPVSSDVNNIKAVLTDGETTITGTLTNSKNGKLAYIKFDSYGTVKGNVTLTLYAWGWTGGYRLGKSIVIDGEIEDAPSSCTAPNHVDVTGDWHIWNEGSMTLTAKAYASEGTSEEITEDLTYQWYLNGTEEGNKITGATSATYSKDNCTYSDAGAYYCKISTGEGCTTTSSYYNVKMLQVFVKDGSSDYGTIELTDIGSYEAQGTIRFASGSHTYKFGIRDGSLNWYGNSGTMTSSNCTNWSMDMNTDCQITTTNYGTYTFTVKFGNMYDETTYGSYIKVSVNYPSDDQASGKVIYFDNTDRNWSNIYYRIGKTDHNQNTKMTAVPGTASLYKATTSTYNDLVAWHISNNVAWSGSNTIYRTYTNDDEYQISEAIEFDGAAITDAAITILPRSGHYKGGSSENSNCDFYYYDYKKFLVTHTATISATSNGSVRLNWTDVSGAAQNATSTTAGLAHTCNLQVTAVPATGYETATLTVNGSDHTSGTVHVLDANAVIAATFSPQVYTINYYDCGGGAFSGSHADGHPTSHTYNTATILKGATLSNYTWDGWYTASDCASGKVTSLGATAYTAGPNLYAKFTQTITLDREGASTGSTSVTATYKSATLPSITNPLKTGYTFGGWYTGDDGTGNLVINTSGALQESVSGYTGTGGIWTSSSARTLHAKWTAKQTTITINANTANHGSTTPGTVTATYASALPSFTAASGASGWSLIGYYTDATSGTKIINEDGTLVASTSYADGSGNWNSEAATLTLYAQYEEEVSCTGDPTALVSGTLYQVSDMASACLGEITGTGQYFYGLSSNGKFYINGTTNSNNASTGTVEIKTASNTIDKIDFTGIAWFKGAGTNTCRSIKFVVPSAGTLTIYGKTSSGNGNVVIKTESSDNTTVIANSVNAYASGSTTVSAGTYYVLSDGTSAAIVGLKFVESACSAPAAPTISGTDTYTANGDNISLTASCASGTDASTTYTWYKGANWATASAASPVQTAKTAAEGGTTFTKEAYDGDGGTYWCEASNGSGCEAHNSTGYAITVNCPAIGTPTTPTIEDLNATEATLGWDPSGMVSGALGYQVSIVVTSTSAEVVAWTSEGITNDRTYTVSGLTEGVGYTFKVRGWSNGCVGSASSVDFTPTATITYTVTFNSNGGSAVSPITQASEDASIAKPSDPTRASYEFDGWYATAGEKISWPYTPTADITLYARWEEECDAGGVAKSTADVPATGYTTYIEKGGDKVVFTDAPTLGFKYKDADGNTINNSTTSVVRNNAYKCQISSDSGNKGSIKTNNAFSNVDSISFYFAASDKSGCKIAVWCSTDDFSADSTQLLSATTYADNNSEFKLKTLAIPSGKKASALRFKFRFTVTSSGKTSYIDSLKVYSSTSGGGTCYHVYYHGNGAESGFVSDTTSYSDGAKATVLSYNDSRYPLTKEDYDFQGWATSAGGSVEYSDGEKITIDGADVHLYAKWATASSALVTWTMNTNTGTWGASATSTTDGTNIGSIATERTGGGSGSYTGATAKVTMADAEVTGSAAPSNSANFTFTIKSSTKQVEISKFDCKVFNVSSGNRTYKAQISDEAGNVYNSTNTVAVSAEASLTDASFVFGSGKILRGDVTIRIYAWKTSGSPTEFRMGPDVKFYGTVEDYECATPSAPTISGVSEYVPGQTITLTASHEGENYDNLTTYTWYKGDTWGSKSKVQNAATGSAGYTFTKASCAAGDAGKYWCEVANGTCNAHNSEGYNIIVYPTYSITYNLNGGTNPVDPAPKTSYTQFDEDYTLPIPTKDGFVFAGWYEASDFSGLPTSLIETNSIGDKSFFAKWGSAVTATWTVTKVDDALYRGGGGYSVKAVIDQTAWNESYKDQLELTATEGVTLKNIVASVVSSHVQVTADFDITTGLATDATEITFTLDVPADGTYAPAELTHDEDLTSCAGSSTVWDFTTNDFLNGGTWSTSGGAENKAYATDGTTILKYYAGGSSDEWDSSNEQLKTQGATTFSTGTGKKQMTQKYFLFPTLSGKGTISVVYGTTSDDLKIYEATSNNIYGLEPIITLTSSSTTSASYTFDEDKTYYMIMPDGKAYFKRIVFTASSGGISPTLSWTPALNTDADWDSGNNRLNKETGDVDFTFVAVQDKNSLGAITYSSNNPSVATVNAAGTVHIVGAAGDATITATLAASGCFEEATATYNIQVVDNCIDEPGTISATDLGCSGIQMTVSGHTTSGETVSYQWYKVGSPDTQVGTNSDTYTTSTAGEYYVVVTNTGTDHCAMASTNTVKVASKAAATATKIVDSWYVKNGRRTPDVALVQTTGATDFIVKNGETPIWNSDSTTTTGFGGCGFHMGTDGIIYLNGTKDDGDATTGLTAGDVTLKITANDGCSSSTSELSITIHCQEATIYKEIAFVVDGDKGKGFDQVTSGHADGTELYEYLDSVGTAAGKRLFRLTEQNIYSTTDEKAIRQHYSQYDAILITDDPSTNKVPNKEDYKTGGYVNAFGTMIDVRPILTMEAYVSALKNWGSKGIAGNPQSPNPRQYEMRLECKDHEIYGAGLPDPEDGTNVWEEVIDGETFRHVILVDSTLGIYNGVAYNVETAGDKKPALQGFTGEAAGSLLGLGRILEGRLQAAIERQEEPAARLLVFGINAKALHETCALTDEGKTVIKNILVYLLKTNMEEVDDCSNYFTGKFDNDWSKAGNWSKSALPSTEAKVRILAPCVVSGSQPHVAQVAIVSSGKSSIRETATGSANCNGKLTINANGALIVEGEVLAAEAPHFAHNDLKPTTVNDLIINTNGSGQAALIFDNEEAKTKATVNYYSLGRKKDDAYQFQYFAVPMEYVDVNPAFAGSGIYTYVWHENGGWERRGYYTELYAFEGVGITTKFTEASHNYTMKGTLASTAEREITLTANDEGDNIIGNSWMAPINIASLKTALVDDDNVDEVVYIYCSGNDKADGDDDVDNSSTETAGQWLAIPIDASGWSGWEGLKVIPAMQAFLIHANAETTLTLNYKDHVRSTALDKLNEKLRAPRRTEARSEDFTGMRMRVSDSQTHADLYLFEGERFSDYYDNGWEAKFVSGDGRSAQFYAMNGDEKMAVLATNDLEGTLIGFAPGKESNYTISFYGGDRTYYLNDIKLKESTLINEENTYTFTFEEGDTNRFYISKIPFEAGDTPTGVSNTDATPKAQKFIYQDKLYILRNGVLYDATGKVVK